MRPPNEQESRAADVIVEPSDAAEIAEIVRLCETDRISLAPLGAARTLAEIRREPVAVGVSLARLRKIVAYEPADMTVTVEAGLSVGEVNRAMESARQRLPIDPQNPDVSSIGASIAASPAGPLRLSEGTVRDLLIGIRYVGAGGKLVHGGGRVVKNVAGYDLMKIMIGSFGTLGIITEATFKVRPTPENYAVAIAFYNRAADAFEAARVLNDAFPPAHLEVMSPAAARKCDLTPKFTLVAGFSGNRPEIDDQRNRIAHLIGSASFLEGSVAESAYLHIRDFNYQDAAIAAQIAMPPAELAAAIEAAGVDFVAHAGSGVAKIFIPDAPVDTGAKIERWREIARRSRGHVRIIHCDVQQRASVDYFDTPGAGALSLMRRLKSAFDPAGIFNPRCFAGGI